MEGPLTRVSQVAKHFPRTVKLIEESSLDVQTIMFSRMASGKHLSNHVGPNKGVIRLLIGLKIPPPSEKHDAPYFFKGLQLRQLSRVAFRGSRDCL